ncbi:TPA: hypothetical protein LUX82_001045 [Enterobacter hormaechei subsp. xiangfangensis]|nr:hypothetical protein [Enterobacter hormaechei subsp. xiangfangensis]HBM2587045.1 hypothetical protein [Enterobacter hormaechei subsp. xiangfangensis]
MEKQFNMNIEDSALFIYGEGGHRAQMNRLMKRIGGEINKNKISLSDYKIKEEWSDKHYVTREFRNKYSTFTSVLRFNQLHQIKVCLQIHKTHRIKVVVSTGPDVALIPAFYFKYIVGAKIIHLETWSRFETKSFTGRIMSLIADEFYVQHKTLLKQYKKAKFSGVL